MKRGLRVFCFATNQSFSFDVDLTDLLTWCTNCVIANVSYYRIRRTLFEQLVSLCVAQRVGPRVTIPEELFIAIKGFLTCRNEALNDDKRLAFDTAVMDLRSRALSITEAGSFSTRATGAVASGHATGAGTSRPLGDVSGFGSS